jgi:hypothetical protein
MKELYTYIYDQPAVAIHGGREKGPLKQNLLEPKNNKNATKKIYIKKTNNRN